jgi:DNA-binding transcriptional LysR family regulator
MISSANRFSNLDLRHLVALETVAREQSFARAAKHLGYTQSAVSQQIAALERAAGTRLLERPRGRRVVEPTEAGLLLLRHADRIVASLRAAEADLRALAAGMTGSLRVGTFQSVSVSVLPKLLGRYRDEWPEVEIALVESVSQSELLDRVETGDLDVAFGVLPLTEGPFEFVELMADPYVLLVQDGSPLADRDKAPTRHELSQLSLIGFSRTSDDIEGHLRGRGITPRYVFRTDESATVQGLVASGFAAAIVPRLTVNLEDTRVRAVELGNLVPPRIIVLVRHRDRYRSPAADAFEEATREVCAELAEAVDAGAST